MGGEVSITDMGETKTVSTKQAKYEITGNITSIIELYDKDTPIIPKEYPVDIQLIWDNTNIELNLVSELGTQEFSNTCSPKNRYFVESEDDLEEGEYKVFINHEGEVDENDLPINLNLSIKTPQNAYEMKLTIPTADLLNLGHVVDVKISTSSGNSNFEINANPEVNRDGLQLIENKYIVQGGGEEGDRNWATSGPGSGSSGGGSTGCYVSDKLTYEEGQKLCFRENNNSDGGVQTDTNNTDTSSPFIFDIKSTLNVAEMGPLGDANYTLIDIEMATVLYESTTTLGSSLGTTGIILLPKEVLNTLVDDKYYMIKIMGGIDVDRDDNGILDEVTTQKKGDLHGLYRGQTLKTDYFKVNILTEVAYQVLKDILISETNTSVLESHLNAIAKKLLLDTSTEVSYVDLTKWTPRFDKKLLRKQYTRNYEPVAQKIYNAEDIYNEAYEIVYRPALLDYSLSYVENSPLEEFSQTIDSGLDNKDVVYTLSGEGSELFEISQSGVISLVSDAVLDYELKQTYILSLHASSNGFTAVSSFILKVQNTLDNPELENFIGTIKESAVSGTVVGTLKYKEGTSPISSFSISGEGSENFEIDENGMIRVSGIATLDYETINSFTFNVNAVNDAGKSLTKVVSIELIDVVDTPVLENLTVSIDENTSLGSVVGHIQIKENGGSDITEITLHNEGSYNFSVSKDGEIRLRKGAQLDFETVASYIFRVIATNIDKEKSVEAELVININDIREPPAFSDATFSINEHSLGGIQLGELSMIDSVYCPITRIDLENVYPMGSEFTSHFLVNNQGQVSVALGSVIDYERIVRNSGYYRYKVNVQATCGATSSNLDIYINDLNENAKIGIGTLKGAYVLIYAIEQNGTINPNYDFYERSNNIGLFNNHKYELEAEKYYLFEGSWGRELDADYDGVLEDNYTGSAEKLRAIVKGKWLNDIEMLKVSPLSEMIVRKIEHQVEGFSPASLDARLLDAARSIVKSDIDGSSSIDVYDSLVYHAKDSTDPYVFVENLSKSKVISDLELSLDIGELNIISIHGGSLSSMELFGEGSEYFNLSQQGVITAKESLISREEQKYSFFLRAIDSNGLESISIVKIRMAKFQDA
ncbi:Predicted cell-wall-anchored protein SasA (LPXTG motif) [hydrothermal vent metagenome]|uniref:Predicted cell-wall-anchored protein SasA (LPXTG motif) n=1 Tax=hydrothermal vent metagenome TaxID=652676 RepID=A0A1W1CW17_9ZZZZ